VDRILKTAALVAATTLLIGYCYAVGHSYAQEEQPEYQLQVKFEGNTAESYTIFADSSSKYTLSQNYSWVRNEASRYNLVAYSVDDAANIEIPRKARGSFVLDVPADSDRSVTFRATVQYPLSAITDSEANLDVMYYPPSPTGDEWFDAASDIAITVTNKEGTGSNTRQHVVGWSLDNSRRVVEGGFQPSFTTPLIEVDGPHEVKFMSVEQHYVNVISAHGTVTGGGWYDAGNTATVIISNNDELLVTYNFDGWDESSGLQLDGMSESFLVDSPKTLTAKWSADYSRVIAIAVATIAAVAIILVKKSSSKASKRRSVLASTPATNELRQRVSTSVPLLAFDQGHDKIPEEMGGDKAGNATYSTEIMDYALTKSIEKLDLLRSSGLVSDLKFTKVKGKLEQAFE